MKKRLKRKSARKKSGLNYRLVSAIFAFVFLFIFVISFYSNYEFSNSGLTGKNLLQIINSLVVAPTTETILVDLDPSVANYNSKRDLNQNSGTGISDIVFDVNGIYKANLNIESSEEKSDIIPEELPGLVYKYLKIDIAPVD